MLGDALAAAASGDPRRYVITGGPSGKDDLIEAFGLGPTPQLDETSRLYRYDTIFVLDPLDTFEEPTTSCGPKTARSGGSTS